MDRFWCSWRESWKAQTATWTADIVITVVTTDNKIYILFWEIRSNVCVLTWEFRLLGSCYRRQAAKQTFIWVRTRPSRLHPLHTRDTIEVSDTSRPTREFLPRSQIKWAKWIFEARCWKILDSGWFDLRSANEISNCANYLRGLGKHKRLVREIFSELVLLSNFKLPSNSPQFECA